MSLLGAVSTLEGCSRAPVPPPPPPSEVLPEDEPLPQAASTLSANTSSFASVYSGASAGDHIVLANGNYGAINLNRSFPPTNRIVIRAQNLLGATASSITITGSGHIVSGLDVGTDGGGARLEPRASSFRFTRGRVTGGGFSINLGDGVSDILIDHCDLRRTEDRMFNCDGSKNQSNIIVARNWVHDLTQVAAGFLGGGDMFGWSSQNIHREKPIGAIIRFNYCGPGEGPDPNIADYIHDKVSNNAYFCNFWDTTGTSLVMRFGLRKRFVGNYAPNANLRQWDDLAWIYGNRLSWIQLPMGRSAYYDETKNLEDSVTGFHACTRLRMAGNNSGLTTLGISINADWCTAGGHATLPDPIPAGVAKPERTFNSIVYAAMPAGDGLSVRAHTGTIETSTDLVGQCITQAVNVDSSPGSAAPLSWRTELFAAYPWLQSVIPDPTSLTGGPSGSAPWSIAQALTRGDAANPNTGPFRDSPGGLPIPNP